MVIALTVFFHEACACIRSFNLYWRSTYNQENEVSRIHTHSAEQLAGQLSDGHAAFCTHSVHARMWVVAQPLQTGTSVRISQQNS